MRKCKICHTHTHTIEDTQMGWVFYRCPKCHFISKDERFLLDNLEEKSQYDMHENSMQNSGYVAMFEKFIKNFLLPFKTQGKLLEFGCGPGPVLATLLQSRGFDVTKYDLFYYPDTTYKQKSFDIITSTEVLEHLQNPLEYFLHFKDILHQDGIICLMTLFVSTDDREFLQWWYRRDPTHISFYHPKTIEYICQLLDMKIKKIDEKNSFTLSLIN